MGATNNIFHGKRRSLFLGILFSSFWSIFLLFRQFSFFLILIQLRYKCSMCCVGLQSDVLHLYFSIGIQIYPRAQCAALACGQGGRYPAADYWPPQIFHPCRSHPCHPCKSHYWQLERLQQKHTDQCSRIGLGEQFRSGIFQNRCLTTRRECSITPRQGAGALHKGAVWVAAALGLVCKKHH